jgi:hypothetical protein
MTYTLPAARIAPLVALLARDPSVMLDELGKGLAEKVGPAQARRILTLAAEATERTK